MQLLFCPENKVTGAIFFHLQYTTDNRYIYGNDLNDAFLRMNKKRSTVLFCNFENQPRFMHVKILEPYKNWKPVKHSVIKNNALADQIHESGYAVIPFLDEKQLQQVTEFYEQEHALQIRDGGMFYSLYSKDLA